MAFQTFKNQAYAQLSEFKITAADGDALDSFGRSVSVSGDYIVVGAFTDGDNGLNSGSAYIFKRNGTSWTQEVKTLPSDGAAGDQFGNSVSISGDYAVMGARYDDDNGSSSGSAYVFKRTGPSWVQEAKLLSSDGAADDWFGFSVSISGDYAVVGAFGDDDNGTSSGSAYVFKRTGTSWTEEAKLLPSDGATDDWFGNKVSISGDYAVVGAWGDDDNGSFSGSAYVFKRTGTSWAQEVKLLASDGAASDYFGFPVSILGDYAVVGASGDGSGSAYVFKRTGTSWAQEVKLLASDGAASDYFGFSVSITVDYAVVGAFADDDNGTDAGSVYLYTGYATAVGVENEEVDLPAEFALSQNYPNPFNPVTVIKFTLPQSGEVSLIVYNLLGQEAAILVNGKLDAGYHQVTWDASNFSSGIYFYRLQTGGFVQTRKMFLLK